MLVGRHEVHPPAELLQPRTSILFIGTPIEQFIDKSRDGVMTTL
jgi:hypothetical protein